MGSSSNIHRRSGLAWLVPVLVVAFALGVWAAYWGLGLSPTRLEAPAVESATVIPHPRPLAPFSLTDHKGDRFANPELTGHWTFMSFGYTSCPDVCPTTLATLARAADLLAQDGKDYGLQYVFVSVDPERDSLEKLASYVPYFNPEFLGVTGDQAALRELTGQLGVLFRRVDAGQSALGYLMDHSASIMLIDPLGRLQAVFSTPHDAGALARDFRAIERGSRH